MSAFRFHKVVVEVDIEFAFPDLFVGIHHFRQIVEGMLYNSEYQDEKCNYPDFYQNSSSHSSVGISEENLLHFLVLQHKGTPGGCLQEHHYRCGRRGGVENNHCRSTETEAEFEETSESHSQLNAGPEND